MSVDPEMIALRQQVAALGATVQRLADAAEIAALIASYGPAVDCGASAAAAALWSEEGAYDLGPLGTARGQAQIAALFDGDMHRSLIAGGAAHLLGPPQIEVEGDTATAVGHSCVARWSGDRFELFRVAANRWRLVRTSNGWRVASRENRLLNGSTEARSLLDIAGKGRAESGAAS